MTTEELVDKIHATPTKAVVIAAGGGSEVLKALLHRGGGSATLLAGYTPYAKGATVELLGGTPDKFASEQTARALAMAAYQKALKLKDGGYPVIGVAATCSLQGVPEEREGRVHTMFWALQTADKTVSLRATAVYTGISAAIQRMAEELLVAEILLNLVAEGCGLSERTDSRYQLLVRKSVVDSDFADLLSGKYSAIPYFKGKPFLDTESGEALLPGSFNPIHKGHIEMAKIAAKECGGRCDLELSILNVDKPALDFISLRERLDEIGKTDLVTWVTAYPTFVQKALNFSNVTFVIGHDTAVRICDSKYSSDVAETIDRLERFGAQFLVFGRDYGPGKGLGLTVDKFPDQFKRLCKVVDANHFLMDISSTQLRKGRNES